MLELFKSRSLSGFLIWLGGTLHWSSKRQKNTAHSSTEVEIYTTDECCESLSHMIHLIQDLKVTNSLIQFPIQIYNDNEASVKLSRNRITKGLFFLQMRENSVGELLQDDTINVNHIAGGNNNSGMFTKEDKDASHFIKCRNLVMTSESNFNNQVMI